MAAASSSRQQPQPCPLVAILFVASTASRGPQVVFRYPRKPQLVRRLSRIRYYTPHGTNKEHVAIDAAEQLRDRAQWDEEGEDSGDEAGATRGRQGEDDEDEEADDVSTDSSTDSSYYQGDSFDDSQTSQGSDSTATTDVESEAAMSTSHTARSSNGSRTRSNRLGRLTTRDAEQTRAASRNQASSDSAPHRTLRSPSRGPRRPLASSSLRNQGSPEPPVARRGGGVAGVQAFARSQQQQQHRANDSPARRARNAKAFSHYLGYPIDFLAEMIAPKSEMCNQRFELVVDDLAFVGHPVFKRAAEQQPQQEARGRPPPDGAQAQGEDSATSSSSPPPIEMLHLVLVLQPPDPSYSTPTLDLTTWLGLWYDNVTFKMTAALWAEEQRCGYVSQQTALLSRLWGAVEGSEGGGGGVSYAKHLSEVLLTSSLARSLRGMFRSLTRQNAQRTPFVVLNDSLEVHLQLPPLLTDPARMVKSILELGPSIEADDPDVWADAVGNPLDEWTRATGPPLFPWKTLLLLNELDGGRGEDKPRRYRSIGGKVVEVASSSSESDSDDEQHRLSNPADAGIEVWARKFTSLLKPTLDGIPTFADLASLLSWDLQADVYPMARHLVYYKQAKVTDVPRIQNTYTVSPLFDASADLQRFALSFSLRFPEQPPLVRLLAVLSSSLQPFVQHFLSLQPTPQNAEASHRGVNALARRRRCLDVLIWLLRHDVILQQHLRFRLIATEAVKRRARERWERSKVKKEEARRRREEKREWRREKRALKRGAKEPGRRRVGELVPLMAQSAPDATRGGVGAIVAAHAVVRARLAEGGRDEHGAGAQPDLVRVRGRTRQRSRSAEARERQQQEQPHPGDGREGDAGEVNNDLDDGTARRAASRISSHSRSRSRNPPPLGRIAASGHLVSTGTGSRSRPGSSSGLRFESHHDPPEGVTTLQFQRRHVSRSRSPSSTMLPPMTPAVTTAAATATGQGPSSSPDETRGSGGGTSSSGAAEAAASTSASGSRHSAGAQSISSVHSVGAGGIVAPGGLSSTPREKAAQILAAEQHQHQQHQQVGQQQQQRKRAASMIRVSSGSSSTGAGPSSAQHSEHAHHPAPPSTSSSSGQRGRRRADSAAASSGGSRRTPASAAAAGPAPASEYHPGRPSAVAGLDSSPMRTFSRSPSQARMRVSGFGGPEEKVWVDGKEVTADTDVEVLAAAAAVGGVAVNGDDDEVGMGKTTSTSAPSSAVGEEDMEESDAAAAAAQQVDAVQSGRRLSLVGEEDGETSPPQQRASPADEGSKVDVDGAAKSSSSIPAKPQETVDDANDDDSSSSDESSDSYSSSSSSSSDSSTNPHTWDLHRPTLISDPSRASRVENAWIDAMLSLHTRTTRTTTTSSSPSTRRRADSDAEDDDEEEQEDENDEDYEVRQAFFRLLPYLNGRHTIDEVVCREGMRRKQLRVLLGRFREEIMTFVHS